MGTVSPLHKVNGDSPPLQCGNCAAFLGDVRAVAHTRGGVKFFCKQEPEDKPEDSCFLQWARRQN